MAAAQGVDPQKQILYSVYREPKRPGRLRVADHEVERPGAADGHGVAAAVVFVGPAHAQQVGPREPGFLAPDAAQSVPVVEEGRLVPEALDQSAQLQEPPRIVARHGRVYHSRQQAQAVDPLGDELRRADAPHRWKLAVPKPEIAPVETGPDPQGQLGTELLRVLARHPPAGDERIGIGAVLDEGSRQRVGVGDEEGFGLVGVRRRVGRGLPQRPVDDPPAQRHLLGRGVHESAELVAEEPRRMFRPLDVAAHPVEVRGRSRQHRRDSPLLAVRG